MCRIESSFVRGWSFTLSDGCNGMNGRTLSSFVVIVMYIGCTFTVKSTDERKDT